MTPGSQLNFYHLLVLHMKCFAVILTEMKTIWNHTNVWLAKVLLFVEELLEKNPKQLVHYHSRSGN